MRAYAPGRVNLIGDHTDYTGGLVLPMAIDLGTTVDGVAGGPEVRLISEASEEPAVVPLDVAAPQQCQPPWARYVAGVVAVTAPRQGLTGRVSSTLPVGAGLSSSAALEVAVALAFGFEGSGVGAGAGVPAGRAAGQRGAVRGDGSPGVGGGGRRSRPAHRLLCPDRDTGAVGALTEATLSDLDAVADPLVRARARHVVTENRRVREMATALGAGDLDGSGALMVASHESLRTDFDVSTPRLDAIVAELVAIPRGVRCPPHRGRLRWLCGGAEQAGGAALGLARRRCRRCRGAARVTPERAPELTVLDAPGERLAAGRLRRHDS